MNIYIGHNRRLPEFKLHKSLAVFSHVFLQNSLSLALSQRFELHQNSVIQNSSPFSELKCRITAKLYMQHRPNDQLLNLGIDMKDSKLN